MPNGQQEPQIIGRIRLPIHLLPDVERRRDGPGGTVVLLDHLPIAGGVVRVFDEQRRGGGADLLGQAQAAGVVGVGRRHAVGGRGNHPIAPVVGEAVRFGVGAGADFGDQRAVSIIPVVGGIHRAAARAGFDHEAVVAGGAAVRLPGASRP